MTLTPTTSGLTDFTLNTTDICESALRDLGVVAFGQTPRVEDLVIARKELSVMVASWRADGAMLWKSEWLSIPLVASSIVVGSDGNGYECIRQRTVTADDIPVTGSNYGGWWRLKYSAWKTNTQYNVGDIVMAYYFGYNKYFVATCLVTHTSNSSIWDTDQSKWSLASNESTAAIVGTTYTSICNPYLNETVLGVGKDVIGIGNANVRIIPTTPQGNPQDVWLESHLTSDDYFKYANKTNPGRPTSIYFKRGLVNELYLYPYPNDTTQLLQLEVYYYPMTFSAAADDADFVMEWYAALIDGLAYRLYSKFPGRTRVGYQELKDKYLTSYNMAKGGDEETGDAYFKPDLGRY